MATVLRLQTWIDDLGSIITIVAEEQTTPDKVCKLLAVCINW